jgi:3-methyladenine DNA glycosylase AlkD
MATGVKRRALEQELKEAGDPDRAASLAGFFKSGKGEYGEGDRFLGITVPVQRKIALGYRALSLADVDRLLRSRWHEFRSVALAILVAKYERGTTAEREEIFGFYLTHTARINNWDLVDGSAPYIVGEHVKRGARGKLEALARSGNLWERRIAMVATLRLVKSGQVEEALRIAEMLLDDRHDLIHKAIGWVLREVGKVSDAELTGFLRTHYERLPRTALRYAIERFPPDERKKWLRWSTAAEKSEALEKGRKRNEDLASAI